MRESLKAALQGMESNEMSEAFDAACRVVCAALATEALARGRGDTDAALIEAHAAVRGLSDALLTATQQALSAMSQSPEGAALAANIRASMQEGGA